MTANQNPGVLSAALTANQTTLLHEASLEIMDRTGMRFHAQAALDLFKKAGARVSDGNLVRIPPLFVERALATAPRDIVIYNRNGRPAMDLSAPRCHFGVGSDCLNIYDLDTGQRRPALLQDVINGVRLVDSLPHLDFLMSMFMPADVPPETYERHQMAVMLKESTKPIIFAGMQAASTRRAVEMAARVAGGLQALQQHPFVINYINPVSAFQHDREGLDRLLYAAERNLPSIYAPGNARGTTAPMTVAGMLALGNAGQLGGLVLSQLKREGSPFILNNPSCGKMDMRSMVDLYATPDSGVSEWPLARRYGLPALGSAGASNAKLFDAQAAAEAALTLFANTASRINLSQNIGYLDSALTGSLELVVFCDEIIGWIKHYLKSLEINTETLALDLIHAVGPDGHFLETDHTLNHVREDWSPTILDRNDYDHWASEGSTSLQQRANRKAVENLKHHRAEPLSEEVLGAIAVIVDETKIK